MRSKKKIVNAFNQRESLHDYYFQQYTLELLADIRDEQVSLNKTLSTVLGGLLVLAQQGTPVKGEEISGAEAYSIPYTGGKKDE